jgi:hypothetical protein
MGEKGGEKECSAMSARQFPEAIHYLSDVLNESHEYDRHTPAKGLILPIP